MISHYNASQRISDFLGHVNRHQQEIRAAGNQAWEKTPRTGEVAIIQKFLSDPNCGSAYLNRVLAPTLSRAGWVVKFASVFLHQMPIVKGWTEWAGTRDSIHTGCELGDLQTLFVYLDANKTVCQIRSVVFQAKLVPASGEYVIKNEFQRRLYDECDGFTYESVLPDKSRRLPSGADRVRALQYLFVGDRPVLARTIPALSTGGAFVDFGEHLLRFLNDATGLQVQPKATTGEDWDHLVWDMIEHVASHVTASGINRNEGLRNLLDHFNSFEDHRISYAGPRETRDGGFGMQLVIVWDGELDALASELADWKVRYPLLAWAEMRNRSTARKLSGAARAGDETEQTPDERWLEDRQAIVELLPRTNSPHATLVVLSALVYLANDYRLDYDQLEIALALARNHPNASEPEIASLIEELQTISHLLYRNFETEKPEQWFE